MGTVLPGCVLFEDDHLLVVNKPAGINTHAPAPYAGEGIYDWLRHREARWARLAIIHRLDKETSGVLVFSKSTAGNQSLTQQFAGRTVEKKYLLLTDRATKQQEFTVRSNLARVGQKYRSRSHGGELAETRFRMVHGPTSGWNVGPGHILVEAKPLTGRTHQIRVHAAEQGFPIVGDTLYGGTSAARVFLHALTLSIAHPISGERLGFQAPVGSGAGTIPVALALRQAFIEPELTNAYRLIHGASDAEPGWYVERFGEHLLAQSEDALAEPQRIKLVQLMNELGSAAVSHKVLTRNLRHKSTAETSPKTVLGRPPTEPLTVMENGLRFELNFSAGYSVGLFLDQRDNRRRMLSGHVAAGFDIPLNSSSTILNTFAYTCGFSVCAAKAGAVTTSLDLSRPYLEWGKRNFARNSIEPSQHDFIYGDAFDWLRRLAKKSRLFDVVLIDPPTFSQSKEHGVFRVEKDLGRLIRVAVPVVKGGGVLFVSTNSAEFTAEAFLASVETAINEAGRKILQRHYAPQPPDFPISRPEPGYLKTVWLRLS
jgi:23S rRNA (cytosine1962-C5)-methyltransferase